MTNSAQPAIRQELPTVEDYLALRQEAGLSPMSIEGASAGLPNSAFAVTVYAGGWWEWAGLLGTGDVFFK